MAHTSALATTPDKIHGRDDDNNKFLIVEDEENDHSMRRKAFFHQQVVTDNQKHHQHWSLPLTYEQANSWEKHEAEEGWETDFPTQLPPGVQYLEQTPDRKRIPVCKIGDEPMKKIIRGIQLDDDYDWLRRYLGLEVIQFLHPGETGIFVVGKVFPLEKLEHDADDIRQLRALKVKKVVIKMYITHQMSRQDQMDRLYDETLAHCELKHPNIVDTYSVRYRVRKAQPNAKGEINAIVGQTDLHSFIVMEYSKLGSLYMLFKKILKKNLGFDYFHCYVQDIIAGLSYLHSTGRAHRELNYTNCLAVQSTRGLNFKENLQNEEPTLVNSIIKICDFAYTKKFDQPGEEELMRNWQSMDVMDLGKNLSFMCFDSIKKLVDKQDEKEIDSTEGTQLMNELYRIVSFLTVENSQQRLDNLQSLKMKEGEDDGKNVRDFMNNKVPADVSDD